MTAAQELILKIKKRIPFFQYSVYQDDFDAAIEKEKEQIIAAMNYSTYREMKGINVSNEEYYNQNYIQKEGAFYDTLL